MLNVFIFLALRVILSAPNPFIRNFTERESSNKNIKTEDNQHLNVRCSEEERDLFVFFINNLQRTPNRSNPKNERILQTRKLQSNANPDINHSKKINNCIGKNIREYKTRVNDIHLRCTSNPPNININYLQLSSVFMNKYNQEVFQNLKSKYLNDDCIIEGYKTARAVLKNLFFDGFLIDISKYIVFKSGEEFVDKDSINQYLNEVKGADIIYTGYEEAQEALKILKTNILTKKVASENIAKLIFFASRKDVIFIKHIVDGLLNRLAIANVYNQIEGMVNNDNPLRLVYVGSHDFNLHQSKYFAFITTLNIKIGIMLHSIIDSLIQNYLYFIVNVND